METTIACPAMRVSLTQKSNHHADTVAYVEDTDSTNTTNTQVMQTQLKHAIMQYHNEQLSLPTDINRMNEEMSISAKEQSIASNTQLKGHAHHYFVSPYNNHPQNRCIDSGGVRLSHPEPLSSSTNFARNYENEHSSTSNILHTSLKDSMVLSQTSKGRAKLASTDKLPPIFSIISPRRIKPTRGSDNKMWLGPPNSIPPNKRNEHIAAYKNISSQLKSSDSRSSRSKSWTQLQQEQHAKNDCEYSDNNQIPPINISQDILENADYSNDDSESESSENYSENSDIISHSSRSTFKNLKLIDSLVQYRTSRSSDCSSSIHMRSMPDLDRTSKKEYTESNFGNYSTKVAIPSRELSYLDDVSVVSSAIRRTKKSVHFAPDTREISRETRAQPLTSATKTYNTNSAGIQLPLTYSGSTESVDQLPAIVEKYMIKNLPILPSINPTAMNVNANIIYIKDGEMQSSKVMSSNTHNNTNNASQPYNGLRRKQQTPEAEQPTPFLSTSNKHEIKVTLPSATQEQFIKPTSTTSTSTSHITPSPSQPNSHRVSQAKKQASVSSTKKVTYPSKKITSIKSKNTGVHNGANSSKKTKKTRNGSETSSRNSTNSVSPVLDPDDPESRYKAYSQAMLAVQARMREFDIKFGSPQKIAIPTQQDEKHFGKVVLPSANKDKLNKKS